MPFDLDPNLDGRHCREITLAGRTLKIAPFVLRNKIKAASLLPRIDATVDPGERLAILVEFIALGLQRAYPGVTENDLLDGEIDIEELTAAADVVIAQAGGRKKSENAAGEAQAPEMPGPTSTA